MSTVVQLDTASVEAIARRVADLIRNQEIGSDLVDANEVARRFSVSRDYVYEHADKLGAVRLGNGSRARLRFDPVTVRERLTQLTVREVKEPQRGIHGAVRNSCSFDPLPIKGKSP